MSINKKQNSSRSSYQQFNFVRLMLGAMLVVTGFSATARADVVTDWNQTALTTLTNGNVNNNALQSRILAITHLAMFDAVNSIDYRFNKYAIRVQAPAGASPEAAAVRAAYRVLLNAVPSQQTNLDAAYAASLAQIPDGQPKTDGIAVGETVAAAYIALRVSDGSTTTLTYNQPPAPGVWRPTPPNNAQAVNVAWGNIVPFALRNGSQFLPAPPPALTSAEYTADFNELNDYALEVHRFFVD